MKIISILLDVFSRVLLQVIFYLKKIINNSKAIVGNRVSFLEKSHLYNISKNKSSIEIGNDSVIAGELLTFAHGGKIKIGDFCFIGKDTRIWSDTNIIIGDRVLISHNVNIHDNNSHPINPIDSHNHFKEIKKQGHPKTMDGLNGKEIIIKDDVWIGFNSIIMKGVTIGEGSIIAAGSLVLKNVPPFCIYGGNPSKLIKKINTNEQKN
jgi:acetyltransferase-like isoleucine patch superfamily enzyme